VAGSIALRWIFGEKMLDLKELETEIKEKINLAVAKAVNDLMNTSEWASQIRSQAIAQFVRTMHKSLPNEVDDKIRDYIDLVFANFEYTGIDDKATKTELTLLDGIVVAENDFVAKNIQGIESIKTNDLIVNGGLAGVGVKALKESVANDVYTRVMSASETALTESVIEKSKAGIDFNSVSINGTPLFEDQTLNSSIKKTSITEVGPLTHLVVNGEALVHNTAYVSNKRVGINTQEPAMSLDVWDEEVQVSIGKRKERTGFIGSNRLQNLQIGVNGKGNITITDKNVVIVENLQIDKNRISWGSEVPGYSGGKGDIVYNTGVGPKNTVFAWVCVGGYNWVALSATVS
jgi:hypothetical protein